MGNLNFNWIGGISFEEILISGDIGIKKPDIKIYETLIDRINCKPDKLIYIGDRLEVDAVASSDAGMLGIWINRKRRLEKKLPKSIVEIYSLSQLSQIMNWYLIPIDIY